MTKEIFELIEEAKKGNPVAQTSLGCLYYYGNGIDQDYEKAVCWLNLAANQHEAQAQYYLGLCYQSGLGVYVDYEKALELFRKSAAQGCKKAHNQISITQALIKTDCTNQTKSTGRNVSDKKTKSHVTDLGKLSVKVRNMRNVLLQTVMGQKKCC